MTWLIRAILGGSFIDSDSLPSGYTALNFLFASSLATCNEKNAQNGSFSPITTQQLRSNRCIMSKDSAVDALYIQWSGYECTASTPTGLTLIFPPSRSDPGGAGISTSRGSSLP